MSAKSAFLSFSFIQYGGFLKCGGRLQNQIILEYFRIETHDFFGIPDCKKKLRVPWLHMDFLRFRQHLQAQVMPGMGRFRSFWWFSNVKITINPCGLYLIVLLDIELLCIIWGNQLPQSSGIALINIRSFSGAFYKETSVDSPIGGFIFSKSWKSTHTKMISMPIRDLV